VTVAAGADVAEVFTIFGRYPFRRGIGTRIVMISKGNGENKDIFFAINISAIFASYSIF
jgi:hypothetical protein